MKWRLPARTARSDITSACSRRAVRSAGRQATNERTAVTVHSASGSPNDVATSSASSSTESRRITSAL
jgi:hypothetical protein